MASLKDIAALCGTSTTTVSLVLNGRQAQMGISEATCRRVLAAASQLHYRFNAAARNIRSGRSDAIGVVNISQDSSVYTWRVLQGITMASARQNYTTKFFFANDHGEEDSIIEQLLEQRVAGVLAPFCQNGFLEKLTRECRYAEIPVVGINCMEGKAFDFCAHYGADDAMGGRLAAEALLGAGCRRLAHVCLEGNGSRWYKLRMESFCRTVAETAPEATIVTLPFDDVRTMSPDSEAGRLLLGPGRPDGIFCYEDESAFFIERFAMLNGLSIPKDFSLIGYGNHPGGECLPVPLTTIAESLPALGEAALKALLAPGKLAVEEHLLPVRLLERSTLRRT